MKTSQYLQWIMPQSTFGVTMVTIACILLIAAFFIEGFHRINDDPRLKVVAMSMEETRPRAEPVGLPDRLSGEEPVEPVRMASASTLVQPAARHGENRAAAAQNYVATLTRTSDCRWAENGDAPKQGSKVRVGQTLNVTSGLVEISFSCGVKAILQGPAVLEIQSAKTSHLKVGRLTADVPDDLEGFKIRTPTATITSLPSDPKAEKPKADDSVTQGAKL